METIGCRDFFHRLAKKLIENGLEDSLNFLDDNGFFTERRKNEFINEGLLCYFLVYWEISRNPKKISDLCTLLFDNAIAVSQDMPEKWWTPQGLVTNLDSSLSPSDKKDIKQQSINDLNDIFEEACKYVEDGENNNNLRDIIKKCNSKKSNGLGIHNISGLLNAVWPDVFVTYIQEEKEYRVANIAKALGCKKTDVYKDYLDICARVNGLIKENKIDATYYKEINKVNSENQTQQSGETSNANSLNQILYGPPGTGKTYNTIDKAVKIIDPNFSGDHEAAKEEFKKYKENGQIEFVTFHQSYGYEEFIEGIKPSVNADGQVVYDIEDGIFKRFCEKESNGEVEEDSDFDIAWNKFVEDVITSGEKVEVQIKTKKRALQWKSSKFYVIDHANPTQFVDYKTVKSVYYSTFERKESNGSNNIKFTTSEGVLRLLKEKYGLKDNTEKQEQCEKKVEPKVFIIDEINRGNVSKIFGELITLIEESKRIGADEEMQVKLPYSGDLFGVPKNVYILGTMNTADRSLVQLDAALRRRFRFIEMMPKPKLLNTDVEGVNLQELLTKINERICEHLDREHQIGHSYFTKVEDLQDLKDAFQYEIIPLLQEYFYDDYKMIATILNNNGFIESTDYGYEINIKDATAQDFKKIYDAKAVDKDEEQQS